MKQIILGLGILACVAFGGCDKKVKSADFTEWAQMRMGTLGLPDAKVTCPNDIPAKVGTTVTCQVAAGGKSYALEVTVTEVTGDKVNMDTKWKDGEVVLANKLGTGTAIELGKMLGTEVAVDCGEPLRFLSAERTVTCDLSAGGLASKLTLTFDAGLVPTDYKLDPPLLGKAKLEEVLTPSVREKTNPKVAVTCGPDVLMLRPADGIVWCGIDDGTEKAEIKVTVDEKLNVQGWEVAKR
jgi:hypothetical protein